MADERDKLIQEQRAEIAKLRDELKRARETQAFLFNLVPEDKLIGALLAAYIERGEQ